jgi:hypothetical protein
VLVDRREAAPADDDQAARFAPASSFGVKSKLPVYST